MRITAGKFRSRVLKTLQGDNTRPTTDKVREAVFSRIGPFFEKGKVLDVFAGSGAVGLEAISRGFDMAVFIEKDYSASQIIRSNIVALEVRDCTELWKCDYRTGLARAQGSKFDLIYCDPPYRLNCGSELAELVNSYDLLEDDGILIIETSREEIITVSDMLLIEKEAVYGISKVTYIRKDL